MKNEVIALIVAVVMLYGPYEYCKYKKIPEEEFGLKWRMPKGAWIESLLATVITLVPLTLIALYGPWADLLPRDLPLRTILSILSGGLAAAVIEEVFYRGFLQTFAVRWFGKVIGILLVTGLFAASHLILGGSYMRLLTFFPGLVMAVLKERWNSVAPASLYHALCNIWAIWLAPRF